MAMNKKKQTSFCQEGYSPHLRHIIERLHLPDEINCAICHLPHPQEHYSKGQLLALRDAIHLKGPSILVDQNIAKCPTCCCAAIVEHKCRFCSHWKGIDSFARSQCTLEQPICKLCQDYFQESVTAAGIPVIEGTIENTIEAEEEPKAQELLTWEGEDAENDSRIEGNVGETVDVENEEDFQGIVTLIGAVEVESPMSRRLRPTPKATNPAGFVKIRAYRPTDSERAIARPESPPPDDDGDEREAQMGTWEYL